VEKWFEVCLWFFEDGKIRFHKKKLCRFDTIKNI
jgi:hypothetical protein